MMAYHLLGHCLLTKEPGAGRRDIPNEQGSADVYLIPAVVIALSKISSQDIPSAVNHYEYLIHLRGSFSWARTHTNEAQGTRKSMVCVRVHVNALTNVLLLLMTFSIVSKVMTKHSLNDE